MADMKKTVFALVVLSLFVAVLSAPKECIKNQQPCVHKNECCDGCCSESKCAPYADGCSAQLNPCSLHACPPGKTCYLQPVTCVAANCDPVPACKDPDYDYE
ncbi:hypothetical protein R5R35_005501 [Gryllus longicercus]|uniref:Accessory gland protein n=1 Tax=Gryllus longicercus TaxID=2509291 RepID=A0AAN9V533_9ORTH|nr:Uncharacterized protein GBIM_08454 [Gryllus bimaculatus]